MQLLPRSIHQPVVHLVQLDLFHQVIQGNPDGKKWTLSHCITASFYVQSRSSDDAPEADEGWKKREAMREEVDSKMNK